MWMKQEKHTYITEQTEISEQNNCGFLNGELRVTSYELQVTFETASYELKCLKLRVLSFRKSMRSLDPQ